MRCGWDRLVVGGCGCGCGCGLWFVVVVGGWWLVVDGCGLWFTVVVVVVVVALRRVSLPFCCSRSESSSLLFSREV